MKNKLLKLSQTIALIISLFCGMIIDSFGVIGILACMLLFFSGILYAIAIEYYKEYNLTNV